MLEIIFYIFLAMFFLWGVPAFAWSEKRGQLIAAGVGHFLLSLLILLVAVVANGGSADFHGDTFAPMVVAYVLGLPILLIYWLVAFLSIALSKTTK